MATETGEQGVTAWSRQSSAAPQFDDVAIANEERVIRICKNRSQITYDKLIARYIFSDQLFAALGPGCSVEFVSLLVDTSPDERVAANASGAGYVEISVGDARSTPKTDGHPEMLKVAYTPLVGEDLGAPNEYHGDIFPKASGGAYRKLRKLCRSMEVQDQALAAELYKLKTGYYAHE